MATPVSPSASQRRPMVQRSSPSIGESARARRLDALDHTSVPVVFVSVVTSACWNSTGAASATPGVVANGLQQRAGVGDRPADGVDEDLRVPAEKFPLKVAAIARHQRHRDDQRHHADDESEDRDEPDRRHQRVGGPFQISPCDGARASSYGGRHTVATIIRAMKRC